MKVGELSGYLKQHWPSIPEQLLRGTYKPQPVRQVGIPKPDGGVRKLGIPTVLDRFIQQAVMQVLQRRWDPTFSEHSHGFRPKRSAHQAVAKAQRYIADGNRWVVDLDLEKFFDRVNHDKLMVALARRVTDKRVGESGGRRDPARDGPLSLLLSMVTIRGSGFSIGCQSYTTGRNAGNHNFQGYEYAYHENAGAFFRRNNSFSPTPMVKRSRSKLLLHSITFPRMELFSTAHHQNRAVCSPCALECKETVLLAPRGDHEDSQAR
jgi:hypothetical protein